MPKKLLVVIKKVTTLAIKKDVKSDSYFKPLGLHKDV